MAPIPFVLEGFEPMDRLGGGGFGEVWLARQSNIDRRVAIKVGHAPIDDKTVQLRFDRECIALGRLSGHPNIVDVYTAGRLTDGRPYLVLEYVSGGTLWQQLHARPLTEPQLVKVGVELAAALSVAHASGVLHRDLKPENVLMRPTGEAVLGDFGIARLHDGANTTSHAITASVAYAPPEILSGGAASVASDLYGIGICLLACVIRSVPFVATTDESIHPIINRVLTDKPPDLRQHGVSGDLSDVIHRLLAKDPATRPASAELVKQQLERIFYGATAVPQTMAQSDSGPTRLMGATAIAPPAYPTGYSPAPPPSAPPANPLASAPRPAPVAQAVPPAPYAPAPYAPAALSSGGGQPSPMQSQPYTRPQAPPRPPSLSGGNNNDRIRLFGAAFGATLLFGGLLLFVIIQLTDPNSSGTSTTSPPVSPVTNGLASVVTTTTADRSGTTGDAVSGNPLKLPLSIDDLGYDPASVVKPDDVGPSSSQYCDNLPKTDGLDDWVGQTVAEPIGFPAVFQELARFETVAQASSYVESYMATIDCDQWVIPPEGDSPEIVLRPKVIAAPTSYGDDTRRLQFEGESGAITLYGRVAVVRKASDVYLVSVTSIVRDDLADVDRLLGVAVARLGY